MPIPREEAKSLPEPTVDHEPGALDRRVFEFLWGHKMHGYTTNELSEEFDESYWAVSESLTVLADYGFVRQAGSHWLVKRAENLPESPLTQELGIDP